MPGSDVEFDEAVAGDAKGFQAVQIRAIALTRRCNGDRPGFPPQRPQTLRTADVTSDAVELVAAIVQAHDVKPRRSRIEGQLRVGCVKGLAVFAGEDRLSVLAKVLWRNEFGVQGLQGNVHGVV